MIGDQENPDYEQALKMLEARRAQPAQQGPMAQSGSSFSSAMDTIQKYQQKQQPVQSRQAPADEAPPQEDSAKTYWAMALSLLGGGRDLGTVFQNATDSYNKRLSAWEARNSPDAKLDRSMKLAQLDAMDRAPQKEAFDQATRLAGVEQADKSQAIQQQQFALTQDQQLFMKQADQVYERARQAAQNKHADESQANAQAHSEKLAYYAQHGMDERHVSEMENQRNMQNQRIEAENARNVADNERALSVAGMSNANRPKAAPTGTVVDDPNRVQTMSEGERTESTKTLNAARAISANLRRLNAIYQEPPTDSNINEYNSIVLALTGEASKTNETGTLQNPEFLRTVKNIPVYGSTKGAMGRYDQAHSARGVWDVAHGRNPALDTFTQLQQQYGVMANAQLKGYGFHDDSLYGTADVPQQGQGGGMGGPPPQPAPVQTTQAAPQQRFSTQGMKGTWQTLGPGAAAPTPTVVAQQQPNQSSEDPAASAMPVQQSMQPQAGIQLKPMTNVRTGQVMMPTSIQQAQQMLRDGWSMM